MSCFLDRISDQTYKMSNSGRKVTLSMNELMAL